MKIDKDVLTVLDETTNDQDADVKQLKDCVDILLGYKEHLSEWLLYEPENAEDAGAKEIMGAIDTVVAGIEAID